MGSPELRDSGFQPEHPSPDTVDPRPLVSPAAVDRHERHRRPATTPATAVDRVDNPDWQLGRTRDGRPESPG
ncbi:hypothetical protein FRAHR75_40082 [Frankia sp. Hr75.2]|nr:hypothetical protein FRAHR75_40082 [Frankia sp. Hr75.2]